MASTSETMLALLNTNKGKLKYDKYWYEKGGIQSLLNECTSPPKIMQLSPRPVGSIDDKESVSSLGLGGSEQDEDERETKQEEDEKASEKMPVILETPKRPFNDSKNDSIITPEVAIIESAIKSYEMECEQRVKSVVDERRRMFAKHTEMLKQQAETQAVTLQLRNERESRQVIHKAQQQIQAEDEEVIKKAQKLRENHRAHAKLLDRKMKEAEERKKAQEEEKRKQAEEVQRQVALMQRMQQEVHTAQESIKQILATCTHPQYYGDLGNKCSSLIAQIVAKVDGILGGVTSEGPTPQQLQVVLELYQRAKNTVDFAKGIVENANKKGTEEEEKKQAAAAAAATAAASTAAAATTTTPSSGVVNTAAAATQPSAPTTTAAAPAARSSGKSSGVKCTFVTEDAFADYVRLRKRIEEDETISQQLTNDASLKKYKFDLQKAINTPVNAIAPTSGTHLREKLQKISTVLAGKAVGLPGNKHVNPSQHPVGVTFCKNLFAKKIVKHGEDEVSSNFESAFAMAAVVVGIWCQYPDVGEMLLGHFHAACPYTVPYYPPRLEGQSNEDWYKTLGYHFVDGAVEQQDKFAKRMTGVMRLYSSIMVTMPPRGLNMPHPHGIEHAWMWLSRVMNLEPMPDITATMIYDLLQVTGHAQWRAYGKQFLKLLQLLCTDFMPKIHAVTPKGAGGPVSRLEVYLQKCISSGVIPPPEGILSPNFWHT